MDVFDLFAKISLDTSEYESGLNEARSATAGAASEINAKTIAMGNAIYDAGKKVVEGVVGIAKSSIDTGAQFDSSMSQVAATMGTTVDRIGELRDFALEMGANTAFSATQAADALNYMALAGYDADTSMSMLPTVLNLAAAGGIDLASASDMVTDAQSALGLSIEETTEMVDKMAMASSKSNTSVAQLGEAILTVGGTAQNLAGGTTELSTALGILADSGIKGAEGGTHLRNVILSLSAPTDTAAGLLDALGVAVFDADGNMRPLNETLGDLNGALSTMTQGEQINAINTIFNKTDIAAVNALLAGTAGGVTDAEEALYAVYDAINNAGVNWEKYAYIAGGALDGLMDQTHYYMVELGKSAEETQEMLMFQYGVDAEDALKIVSSVEEVIQENGVRWEELSGYIDNAADSAQDMADTQLDNLAGDFTLLESAIEGLKISIADELNPAMRSGAQLLTSIATSANDFVSSGGLETLIKGFKTLAPLIVAAAVALGTYKTASAISTAIELLTKATEGQTIAQAALNAVMNANPFVLVATAIAALVAGVATLWATNEDFRNAIIEIWGNITEAILGSVDKIKEIIGGIKDAFGSVVTGVKDLLGIHSPSRVFAGIGENMALGLGEGWQDEFSQIKKNIEDGMDFGTANMGLDFQTSTVDFPSSGLAQVSRTISNEMLAGMSPYVGQQNGGDIIINLTAELDGTTLARKMYTYNKQEEFLRGSSV